MRLHTRQVKAGFWDDPDLAQLPLQARMLFAGMWALADDSGCLEDSPMAFKLKLFASPVDADLTVELLATHRDKLLGAGMLVRYRSGRKDYLFIVNFHAHQKIRNPGSPVVPLPEWIEWRPTQSNDRTGRYIINQKVLTLALHGAYEVLTDGLQRPSEPFPEFREPFPEVSPPPSAPAHPKRPAGPPFGAGADPSGDSHAEPEPDQPEGPVCDVGEQDPVGAGVIAPLPESGSPANVRGSRNGRHATPDADADAVKRVMDRWNAVWTPFPWRREKALTDLRRDKIRVRLTEFTEAELCAAIDNLHTSPHHVGDNDRKWAASPEWLFKSREQVERFVELPAEGARASPGTADIDAVFERRRQLREGGRVP